jgi:hypothetical protein
MSTIAPSEVFGLTMESADDSRNPSLGPLIQDKLLKFQAMTSLLDTLRNASVHSEQSQQPEDLIWNLAQDGDDDQSILSALATLLVQNNEIVTVTMRSATMPGRMEVVACSHAGYPTSSMPPEISSPSAMEGTS